MFGAAAAVLCISALAVGGGESRAAFEGKNGRIAFARILEHGFASQIYTVNPDGTDIEQLTDGCCIDEYMAWSPNGRRLAFARDRRLFIIGADGERLHRVTRGKRFHGTKFSDLMPSWSPDGHRLVFARIDDTAKQQSDLFSVRASGKGLRQVTSTRDLDELYPAWSPAGDRIAFSNRRPAGVAHPPKTGVYLVRADGEGLTPVATGHSTFSIDWAPDAGRLVYARAGRPQQLVLVDADGRHSKQLTHGHHDAGMPAFSPSGTRLVFSSEGVLMKLRLGGAAKPRRLLELSGGGLVDPSWQPR